MRVRAKNKSIIFHYEQVNENWVHRSVLCSNEAANTNIAGLANEN